LILIAIGANLPSPRYGEPRATCGAALTALAEAELSIAQRSRWYKSAPVPISDQPWYINGAVRVKTALPPVALMTLLLEIEESFGRSRNLANEARFLDLDLLAYGELALETTLNGEGSGRLQLPHPRLHERAFVLLPLLVGLITAEQGIQALAETAFTLCRHGGSLFFCGSGGSTAIPVPV